MSFCSNALLHFSSSTSSGHLSVPQSRPLTGRQRRGQHRHGRLQSVLPAGSGHVSQMRLSIAPIIEMFQASFYLLTKRKKQKFWSSIRVVYPPLACIKRIRNTCLDKPIVYSLLYSLRWHRPAGIGSLLLGAALQPMQSVDVVVMELFRRAAKGPLWAAVTACSL